MTTAAPHDIIRVRGARQNNLRGLDVDIPKRRITVFTGVSGSGKSSLVFGTIAAESQRLINETYSAFVQQFMASPARPDVESLEGLSATIVVDQERMGSNGRSTVGTATDAYTMLRILFSRIGDPHAGTSGAFSFSLPEGMCPRCEGTGRVSSIDLDALIDRSKSLEGGALDAIPNFVVGGWYWKGLAESGLYPADVPIAEFTAEQMDAFLHRPATRMAIAGMTMTYEGLLVKVTRLYLAKEAAQPHIRAFADRVATFAVCPECGGGRLTRAALGSRIAGRNIAECSAMQATDLAGWLRGMQAPSVAPIVETLLGTLDALVQVGLGYLSLDRESGTLSGGEAQRVKMVRHLGSSLTDVTYVFDEPTAGLHPHDVSRMIELLRRLRDKGNTVLVVEHKPEIIEIADHVIDLGPRAGAHGGELQFEGTVAGLRASDTLTGRHLGHRVSLKESVRRRAGAVEIRGAATHNLRSIDVDVPLGVLTVVTGVAGSGKSSLLHGSLAGRPGVVVADQSPIRGSRRSNPATYTGVLDAIRAAFAKANGVKPALFSANSAGACPVCKGAGMIFTELGPAATVSSVCEECKGKRFTAEVLEYRLRGKNIHEVLSMPIVDAAEFFAAGAAHTVLARLVDVGLGYLTLGQPLNTLSGGERQRLKLAINMASSGSVYLLDEPTTGLHLADVDTLLGLLDRLVDSGNSVVVIEHHRAVMAHADWVIDVGPGAGHDGGTVVFEGTPAGLAGSGTLTGRALAEYVR
ncbi:ATP-binding cassette domain-containing protein [Rathayibacter rathayi]|uniref:ATP-binding cassette domain-containing protein n=1 Tax=Rathayibacter rathayi TaxID=33887 RepID=UPI000CE91E64|nr:excinuclease ABC subunit UvrA [Rathayibacter rathayi]PPF24139.1 daunorubicin resistance protein DrrC [Rathayibacter rathayi]PPG94391.1 daunorubicin resistance protein DrrC [Rathayibacter rathayi]